MRNILSKRFRVTRTFVFTAPILLLATTVSLSWWYYEQTRLHLIAVQESKGLEFSAMIFPLIWKDMESIESLWNQTSTLSKEQIISSKEYKILDQSVRSLLRPIDSIVKVKLFNLNGRTIYSTEPALAGIQNPSTYPGFYVSKVEKPQSVESFRERFSSLKGELSQRWILESYIPMQQYQISSTDNEKATGPAGKEIKGVAEIYTDITPFINNIRRSALQIAGVTGLTLSLTFLLLGALILRAERYAVTKTEELEKQRRLNEDSDRLQLLGRMAGRIAHEINNPIAVILSSIELLEKSCDRGTITANEVRKRCNTATKHIERAAGIIKSMRSLTGEKNSETLSNISLGAIITDAAALKQTKMLKNKVEFRYSATEECNVKCNSSQLTQVMVQLFDNAIDATSHLMERWIEVTIQRKTKHIEVVISDSGTGIPPVIQDKIMQPFYTTKPLGQGEGLGLCTSQAIIEHHRGRLYLDENAEHTRFVIELPFEHTTFQTEGIHT